MHGDDPKRPDQGQDPGVDLPAEEPVEQQPEYQPDDPDIEGDDGSGEPQ